MPSHRVLLAGLAAAVLTGPGVAIEAEGPLAGLQRMVLERSGGDLGQAGVLAVHTARGVQTRAITGHDFLAALRAVAGEAPPRADDVVGGWTAVGYGVSHPPATSGVYPHACAFWIFALYLGNHSSVVHAAPNDLLPIGSGPISSCPYDVGVLPTDDYGPTRGWLDITFDLTGLTPLAPWPCMNANVMVPAGPACGWTVGCVTGNGVLNRYTYMGFGLDFFLGTHAYGVVGQQGLLNRPICIPGAPALPG